MGKYNVDQVRYLLHRKLERPYEFADLMDEIKYDMDNAIVYKNIRRLLFKIYELNLSGRNLTKTQACVYIPSSNNAACYKYVHKAKSLGYIKFERSKEDKRRYFVIAQKELLKYVESELDKEIDSIREVLGEILKHGSLPVDNLAFSGASQISSPAQGSL